MSISYPSHRFQEQWSALAAAVLLISLQQNAAAATIHVNTRQQGITDSTHCSLQEAIYASEFKMNTAIGSTDPDSAYTTGCTPGTGDDTIVLDDPGVYPFDHFWDGDAYNKFGPTATPIILSRITIEGNSATLQSFDRFRPNNSRLFAIGKGNGPFNISGTGDLTLRNVYIKGFHIKGGDGGDGGGGGGLGAGGAIYVDEGSLTVENSTFENNGAVGGNGRAGTFTQGGGSARDSGGGGGLSGNGGDGCSGGGGGSRGDGGKGATCNDGTSGGGGGGTVFSGGPGQTKAQGGIGGASGFRCGGNGGDISNDGHDGCPGGGGGAGGGEDCSFFPCMADGGKGNYGGGGGGGGMRGDGADGGYGGGGGASATEAFIKNSGGNGGFGGGGGAADNNGLFGWSSPGKGGRFGGHADKNHGGGGGALGGAIFSRNGVLQVHNSTFFNNYVTRGEGGGGLAANGADAGGAIFSFGIGLEVNDSTFSGNQATGSGGAIVVFVEGGVSVFRLNNTLIANNGANECFARIEGGFGAVDGKGAGNLITHNGSGAPFLACPGVATFVDPQLQPLQLNFPGKTPTMAIQPGSSAIDQADPQTSLATDQRGVTRPQGAGFDIGAVEVFQTTTWNPSDKGAMVALSNGNLTFTLGAGAAPIYNGVRSTASASSGKKYWELTANTIVSPANGIVEGMGNTSFDLNANHYVGSNLNGIGWGGDGVVSVNGAAVANIQGWTQGDVLCFAVDLGSSKIWFRRNGGSWNNNAANDPATNVGGIDISNLAGGPYFPIGQGFDGGDTLTANFGASAYTYPVPSGFGNW